MGKRWEKYGIEVNEVLSEEAYLEIMLELLPARAKKKALHLLERMDRTEQQLRTKLTEGRISVGDRGNRHWSMSKDLIISMMCVTRGLIWSIARPAGACGRWSGSCIRQGISRADFQKASEEMEVSG